MKFVAELDPAVFVLDCLPNMGPAQVTERTVPGVKILRDAHPDTPILLVEDRNIQTGFLVQARRKANEANHAALREAYAAIQAEKMPAALLSERRRPAGQRRRSHRRQLAPDRPGLHPPGGGIRARPASDFEVARWWGSQSWLHPAFRAGYPSDRSDVSKQARNGPTLSELRSDRRLKAGGRQDCLPHSYIPGAAAAISFDTPLNFAKFLLKRAARSRAARS